jgi:hypothetical protein
LNEVTSKHTPSNNSISYAAEEIKPKKKKVENNYEEISFETPSNNLQSKDGEFNASENKLKTARDAYNAADMKLKIANDAVANSYKEYREKLELLNASPNDELLKLDESFFKLQFENAQSQYTRCMNEVTRCSKNVALYHEQFL